VSAIEYSIVGKHKVLGLVSVLDVPDVFYLLVVVLLYLISAHYLVALGSEEVVGMELFVGESPDGSAPVPH